jgi:hypothetical protein
MPALDVRQWAAIASSLPGRRRARVRAQLVGRWSWRLAGTALAAGAAAAWLLAVRHPPLTYVTKGCQVAPGGGAVATAADEGGGRVDFSDGSSIALDGGTRGRIVVPDQPSRAQFVLESGAAELDVVHRRDTRWAVEAGPFHVDVKGTQFHVAWSPAQRRFRLEMRRGEVAVSGRSVPDPLILRAGEAIEVIGDEVSVEKAAPRDDRATANLNPPELEAPGNQAPGDQAPEDQAAATPRRPPLPSAGSANANRVPSPQIALPPTAVADPPPAGCDSTSARAATDGCPPADRNAASEKDESMNKNELSSRTSRTARMVGIASAIGMGAGLLATASVAAPPSRPGSPVFIASDGKLSGPMTGYAWVAGAAETTTITPPSCNDRGCFKEAKGQLCTRGTIPALRCTGQGTAQYSCNWESDWGSMIGLNTTSEHGPWQSGAPASVSLAYHGERGTYRLNAHVFGDPASKVYCVDAYQSGQVVEAGMLKTECWADAGQPLRDFQAVDQISLLLTSTEAPAAFDYCVTAIAVNGAAGRASEAAGGGHVAIENNGKLGGGMTGYAWVAGGAGTAFSRPQTCNQNGCFKNRQARLCAQGTIASLACTGQGTSQLSCDWQTNWGAMIGMNANLAVAAWGAAAPSTVAVSFSGPAAIYRLMAHVAGDPDSQSYCIDGYQSGQAVDARMLKSKCWSDSGDTLPSYQKVDKIGLQVMSAEGQIPFDVCVSDIQVR